jgi:CHC2 zinc finger/Toprim-like
MNIDKARSLAITDILEKMGVHPSRKNNNDWWYKSPFRNEKTPSFHVNINKNVWYDFGESMGGDSVSLVCHYLRQSRLCHTVSDALRWLDNMFHEGISIASLNIDHCQQESDTMVKSSKPLSHIALIRYIESRGISQSIAQKYLKEIRIYNKSSKKEYFAAGIKNEEGGYDYRNPYFKGCVHRKTITFIRGTTPKPDGIHFFEGFMDFLTAIMQNEGKKFEDDVIILNSLSCLPDATGYIRGYGYRTAWTWLDNDDAGKRATHALGKYLEKERILHIQMNPSYWPYKDLNECHMANLSL